MRTLKLLLFTILISTQGLFSQTVNDNRHEITIYFTSSVSPINWTNPSVLFKSTNKCYINAAFKKNFYVIGHTQAIVNSTLLPASKYTAMTGAIQSEKVDLVLNKKVGFGALGSTIHGKMESEERIKKGIALYANRNKVSYIKFRINAEAATRILEFIDYYSRKNSYGFAPCEYYNGALWPRYEHEGSGCSAYGISLLDIANLLPLESKDWYVDVNVPMELIGGEFNNKKKIKFSTIFRTKSWHNGNGKEGVDYVNYKVFDPSIIHEWILNRRSQNDSIFQREEENGVPGLVIDRRNVTFDVNDSVLKHRTDTTLFAKHYYEYIRKLKNKFENLKSLRVSPLLPVL